MQLALLVAIKSVKWKVRGGAWCYFGWGGRGGVDGAACSI